MYVAVLFMTFNRCVLCSILIFIFVGARRVGAAGEYGTGHINTPIHLGNLQCDGDEGEIYQCMGDEQPSSCTHDNDVSVECLRKCILSTGIFELICDVIQSMYKRIVVNSVIRFVTWISLMQSYAQQITIIT